MAVSVLSRFSSPDTRSSLLSPLQSQVDGLVSGFAQQATDWRSLASMTAGGMAYRAGRIGVMGLGNGSVLRAVSVGLGLTAEVSTFEITHRGLSSVTVGGHGRAPLHTNLGSWNGAGGIRQGLLQSFVTFGALKGAGRLAQGENFIAQHLFQDTAMVLGHQVTGALGIVPRPEGSLAEQFLHAEAMNLQLGAGAALAHGLAPRIAAFEKGLDLSLQIQIPSHRLKMEVWGNLAVAQASGSSPVKPLSLLSIAQTRGGGLKKVETQSQTPRAALGPLRELQDLREELPPLEEASLLLKLARLFHQAGLSENAEGMALQAMDAGKFVDESVHKTQLLLELGESWFLLGRLEKAQSHLRIAAGEALKLNADLRADFYERIAVLQSKTHRGSGQELFRKAQQAIEEMNPERRPAYWVQLAQRMIEAKELNQARALLDRLSFKLDFKSFALSDLAAAWVLTPSEGEGPSPHTSLAMALFREARVDLTALKKARSPLDRIYALHYLAKGMLSAGPDFQDEAGEVIAEIWSALKAIASPEMRQEGTANLIKVLIAARDFDEAHELTVRKIREPEKRSALLKILMTEAVKAGRAVEVGALLDTERLHPADRFEVLLKIADSLDETRPGSPAEKKAVLGEALRYIQLHEFHPPPRRIEGLIQLGLRLAKLHELPAALSVFRETESALNASLPKAKNQIPLKIALALAKFEALALPLLKKNSADLFHDLYEAIQKNRRTEIARLSTLLGFRRDSFRSAMMNLSILPFEQRDLVKAWLLLGASYAPLEREEREKIAQKIDAALQRVSRSKGPARIHRILIRALWNLSPEALEAFLLDFLQEKIDPKPFLIHLHSPFDLRNPKTLEADPVVYQSLSWLARYGSHVAQGFVSQFISTDRFPESWARPLRRALKNHGYSHQNLPKILN